MSAPDPEQSSTQTGRSLHALALACATVLGVGYVPVAPGTFGSLVGLLIWYALPMSALAQSAAIAAVVVIGSWSGTIAERQFRRVDPG